MTTQTTASTYDERTDPAIVTPEKLAGIHEFVLADFGDRKLVRFDCTDCHETFELCLRADDARRCLDCRADHSRQVDGWTPENSLS